MPYNISRRVCVRMRKFLVELESQKTTIDFHSRDPQKLAYNLREALYACQFQDADFRKYAPLRELYKFWTLSDRVRAEFKGITEPRIRVLHETPEKSKAEKELANTDALLREIDALGGAYHYTLETIPIPKVATLNDAIGAAIKYGKACKELHFPDLTLNEADLGRLWRWAEDKGYKIIDNLEGGITLTTREVDEELIWTPSISE